MHSTYVRMAMDRQRAEHQKRGSQRKVSLRSRIADFFRKLVAFLFTQVRKSENIHMKKKHMKYYANFGILGADSTDSNDGFVD